ncbi:hypothetical protein MtrunA17_Chr8g0388411 [Medicago truncatula]|uniref:Uncharacterized protein n=1 Tax=Medicago truncatula TaxID=3880 RepID=A0A072TUP6_MEDTR|nr:uncharacterized protein LOC25502209 [Medicago truncatula]KEH21249.1 hypothetical protein MTR_8g099615 [Medicago truncatula]RHN43489.1 hypothetical protein MtrunA17_Chr8g0388411 [Medicago truncatula]
MTTAFFTVPTPQHYHHVQLYKPKKSWSTTKILVPPTLCSPTSLISSAPDDELAVSDQSVFSTKQSGCKACGNEEIEKGCNGEGRMQGGIATVPGFGWWPIKAYRPCPGFVASGGKYRRQGQSMDEVVSGSGKIKTSTATDSKSSSKKDGSKKLKS